MIGRIDFWLAIGAAAGLHIAALAVWPLASSGGGAGASGTETISVAAADPALQALVETWERAPEAAVDVDGITAPQSALPPTVPSADIVALRAPDVPALPVPTRPEPSPERTTSLDSMTAPEASPTETVVAEGRATASSPTIVTPAPLSAEAAVPPNVDTTPPPPRAIATAPRPDPRPSRPAVAERRATGSGAGTTTGQTQRNAARASTSEERAAAQARWAADIQRRIARHQTYPRGARASGRVQVSMVILRNGSLGEVSVARSSGASRLDQAALRAVQLAAPFPPAPDALTDTWYRVGQWISFERR